MIRPEFLEVERSDGTILANPKILSRDSLEFFLYRMMKMNEGYRFKCGINGVKREETITRRKCLPEWTALVRPNPDFHAGRSI